MRIQHVDPSIARDTAVFLTDLIEKAANASPETPESLIALAENGRADFWIAYDDMVPVGVCFSQILQRPKERVVNVIAIAGARGRGWLRNLGDNIKTDGRKYGASKVVTVSPKPSLLGLKPIGYIYEDIL